MEFMKFTMSRKTSEPHLAARRQSQPSCALWRALPALAVLGAGAN
jgi:hypothetical protein